MTDREKLRKLATVIQDVMPGIWYESESMDEAYGVDPIDAEFIAAANPAAVLGLLDQCDAAVAKLYAAEEKLGEIVAERDALRAHVHELRTELKGAEAQRQRLIQKEAEA